MVLPYNAAVLTSHRGIPAYAGMTVGGQREGRFYMKLPCVAANSSLRRQGVYPIIKRPHPESVRQN